MQILRQNKHDHGFQYKTEYLENGKIDVKKIVQKMNKYWHMEVKPHNFKFSKAEKFILDKILEKHEK